MKLEKKQNHIAKRPIYPHEHKLFTGKKLGIINSNLISVYVSVTLCAVDMLQSADIQMNPKLLGNVEYD